MHADAAHEEEVETSDAFPSLAELAGFNVVEEASQEVGVHRTSASPETLIQRKPETGMLPGTPETAQGAGAASGQPREVAAEVQSSRRTSATPRQGRRSSGATESWRTRLFRRLWGVIKPAQKPRLSHGGRRRSSRGKGASELEGHQEAAPKEEPARDLAADEEEEAAPAPAHEEAGTAATTTPPRQGRVCRPTGSCPSAADVPPSPGAPEAEKPLFGSELRPSGNAAATFSPAHSEHSGWRARVLRRLKRAFTMGGRRQSRKARRPSTGSCQAKAGGGRKSRRGSLTPSARPRKGLPRTSPVSEAEDKQLSQETAGTVPSEQAPAPGALAAIREAAALRLRTAFERFLAKGASPNAAAADALREAAGLTPTPQKATASSALQPPTSWGAMAAPSGLAALVEESEPQAAEEERPAKRAKKDGSSAEAEKGGAQKATAAPSGKCANAKVEEAPAPGAQAATQEAAALRLRTAFERFLAKGASPNAAAADALREAAGLVSSAQTPTPQQAMASSALQPPTSWGAMAAPSGLVALVEDSEPQAAEEERPAKLAKKGGSTVKTEKGRGRAQKATAAPSGKGAKAKVEEAPVTIPLEQAEDSTGSSRSKRQRMAPLQHWRNEQVVYERNPGSLLPTITAVRVSPQPLATKMSVAKTKPKASRARSSRTVAAEEAQGSSAADKISDEQKEEATQLPARETKKVKGKAGGRAAAKAGKATAARKTSKEEKAEERARAKADAKAKADAARKEKAAARELAKKERAAARAQAKAQKAAAEEAGEEAPTPKPEEAPQQDAMEEIREEIPARAVKKPRTVASVTLPLPPPPPALLGPLDSVWSSQDPASFTRPVTLPRARKASVPLSTAPLGPSASKPSLPLASDVLPSGTSQSQVSKGRAKKEKEAAPAAASKAPKAGGDKVREAAAPAAASKASKAGGDKLREEAMVAAASKASKASVDKLREVAHTGRARSSKPAAKPSGASSLGPSRALASAAQHSEPPTRQGRSRSPQRSEPFAWAELEMPSPPAEDMLLNPRSHTPAVASAPPRSARQPKPAAKPAALPRQGQRASGHAGAAGGAPAPPLTAAQRAAAAVAKSPVERRAAPRPSPAKLPPPQKKAKAAAMPSKVQAPSPSVASKGGGMMGLLGALEASRMRSVARPLSTEAPARAPPAPPLSQSRRAPPAASTARGRKRPAPE
eukprot:TRINITY_DN5372_c0_g1_i2.p1 TRINITY_DN5372_c0_g1~~TRINITY_DN5372_c0_g1_i2.p1  ORF type:complete len:1188 (+),score=338.14 TRINITY_DN5372_c0_g1_i2:86-3649(+)